MGVIKTIGFIIVFISLSSCGPGYKMADRQLYKVKNHNDLTVITKSKYKHETAKSRKVQQRKQNIKFWKKQMKNRYKY